MSTRQLSEVITTGGIRSINFFNGRLLTAEDMTQEQGTRRDADGLLGRSLGAGIASGLEVSGATSAGAVPVVTVQAGLAINARGQVLGLSDAVDLSLVRPVDTATSGSTSGFSQCQPPQPGVYVADAGVYLLVICPASATEGRAPVNGLNTCTSSCNAKYNIDGIQFRLVPLDPAADLGQPALLRNLVAYECYGSPGDPAAFVSDPFAASWDRNGLLDVMRRNQIGIGDCDVPLAVIYWTLAGIQFIDMWSVRRGITQPDAARGWPLLFGDRRRAEAQAMIQQFENQIEDVFTTESNLDKVKATDRFVFLPPAGMLPMLGNGSPKGFNAGTFFGAHASRAVATMDGAALRSLFAEALDHEPIDLRSPAKIQLYVTIENLLAVQQGLSTQLALIFASQYLTRRETARYSLASFGIGHFASDFVR